MADSPRPYIASCPLCEQGLIRVASCRACHHMTAICDECEAIWKDPKSFLSEKTSKPDSQHPACPHCGEKTKLWQFATDHELDTVGLRDLVKGHSA